MKRFILGEDRNQSTLFPESLEDYIAEDNSVRVVDAYVDELDLASLGFERVNPKATGRPWLSPICFAQALHIWLSQPDTV